MNMRGDAIKVRALLNSSAKYFTFCALGIWRRKAEDIYTLGEITPYKKTDGGMKAFRD
jgi:hypothetical protein